MLFDCGQGICGHRKFENYNYLKPLPVAKRVEDGSNTILDIGPTWIA